MEKKISYCGIICSECPAYIATQNNDDKARKEIAEKWSKEFNSNLKHEDVNCDGCLLVNGRKLNYCNTCDIRKCGVERELKNCAYCDDYTCDKLNKFHENNQQLRQNLDDIRKNLST